MTNAPVELARIAVLEIGGADQVGQVAAESRTDGGWLIEFAATHPGYVGWRWCCALSGDPATIDEVWMQPGEGALVAAPWRPWSERILPGDLSAGDVLPTAADDPRLMPGYAQVEEVELAEPLSPAQWSIGLGRERVLSALGIDDAVDRWREGENGPRTATARYAEAPCATCGWLVTIGGRLGQAFGVCANAMSPSDGRIVSMDHGCGAHSEIVVEAGVVPVAELVLDELAFDEIDRDSLPEVAVEPIEANSADNDGPDTAPASVPNADDNPDRGVAEDSAEELASEISADAE